MDGKTLRPESTRIHTNHTAAAAAGAVGCRHMGGDTRLNVKKKNEVFIMPLTKAPHMGQNAKWKSGEE